MKTITLTLPEPALRGLFKFLDRVPLEGREVPEFVNIMNGLQPKMEQPNADPRKLVTVDKPTGA